MKKIWFILIIFVFSGLLEACTGQPSAQTENMQRVDRSIEKIRVVTSFYPVYDFAAKVGGDRISLVNLTPSGTEPHDWEPSTADLMALENADVFLYSGAGMEHWVDDVLNNIGNKKLIVKEASDGITLLAANPDHAADGYDPHVWLDPEKAKAEMQNIKNALSQADPAGESLYEKNFQRYAQEFDTLDQLYRDTLSSLPIPASDFCARRNGNIEKRHARRLAASV